MSLCGFIIESSADQQQEVTGFLLLAQLGKDTVYSYLILQRVKCSAYKLSRQRKLLPLHATVSSQISTIKKSVQWWHRISLVLAMSSVYSICW